MENSYQLQQTMYGFLRYCLQKDLSKLKIYQHLSYLNRFSSYCHENEITYVEQITPLLVDEFEIYLKKDSTWRQVESCSSSLKAFFSWFDHETGNNLSGISKNKSREVKPLRTVTQNAISSILATCENDLIGVRDIAILQTLSDTGMRVTELCALRVRDFSFNRCTIAITTKESYSTREVKINHTTAEAINRYLKFGTNGKDRFLFCSQSNRTLLPANIAAMLRHRSFMCGILDYPSPNDLRNTFGVEIYRKTRDPEELRRLLGLKTTSDLGRYAITVSEDF